MTQTKPAKPLYEVQKVSVIVEAADVQVRELTVAPGEEVPWHSHTQVTDWCYARSEYPYWLNSTSAITNSARFTQMRNIRASMRSRIRTPV